MDWIQNHKIDQYVRIDALTDAILDLLDKISIEPILIGEN